MSPIESILYMIWRGFAIGVLISAPMGPVGMLCIQRTLDKGRKAGFYTGIGAAISDLLYCLITGFFLSLIEDFLQENQNIIQLFGSLVLIAFSIYLFKKNPSSSLPRPVPQNVSAKKNILGGFLFTVSNPLIIFLIIGLFARFNFSAPEIKGGFYAIGYIFIVAGALAWWYGVTHLIERVRTKFNMRSMKKMNVAIGLVILAFACVGIVTSVIGLFSAEAKAQNVGMPGFVIHDCKVEPMDNDSALTLDERYPNAYRIDNKSSVPAGWEIFNIADKFENLKDVNLSDIGSFQLDFKLQNNHSQPGKKYEYFNMAGDRLTAECPAWSITMKDFSGNYYLMSFHVEEYWTTLLSSEPTLFVFVDCNGEKIESSLPYQDLKSPGALNHFRIIYDAKEDIVKLSAGNHKLGELKTFFSGDSLPHRINSICISADSGSDITLLQPVLTLPVSPSARWSEYEPEEINSRLASSVDPVEGHWKQLDYTVEEKQMKLGGEYELNIVRLPNGDYEMIYVSGADKHAFDWQPQMIKGRLSPTGHEGVFSLEWRDVYGATIPVAATAQQESMDILTLHFPATNSKLRFKRL